MQYLYTGNLMRSVLNITKCSICKIDSFTHLYGGNLSAKLCAAHPNDALMHFIFNQQKQKATDTAFTKNMSHAN